MKVYINHTHTTEHTKLHTLGGITRTPRTHTPYLLSTIKHEHSYKTLEINHNRTHKEPHPELQRGVEGDNG